MPYYIGDLNRDPNLENYFRGRGRSDQVVALLLGIQGLGFKGDWAKGDEGHLKGC